MSDNKIFFDENFYMQKNPDLLQISTTGWEHFVESGFVEGRDYISLEDEIIQYRAMSLDFRDENLPLYIKAVIAEINIKNKYFDVALNISRMMGEAAGAKFVSLELRSLIGLDRILDAANAALDYYKKKMMHFSWYSDHKIILDEIMSLLIKQNLYSEANNMIRCIDDWKVSDLIKNEIYYISQKKPNSIFLNTDSYTSRGLGYQAEVRAEIDISIEAYSRAIILGHSEGDYLSKHINSLIIYQVNKLIDNGCFKQAINYAKDEAKIRKFDEETRSVLVVSFIGAFEQSRLAKEYEICDFIIKSSFEFDPPPYASLIISINRLILENSLIKDEKRINNNNFIDQANQLIASYVGEYADLRIKEIVDYINGLSYRLEYAKQLVDALNLALVAINFTKNPVDLEIKRISLLGRLTINSLFENKHEESAVYYSDKLFKLGYINPYEIFSIKNTLQFAKENGLIYEISRPEREINAPILKFYKEPRRLTAVRGELTAPATYYAQVRDCLVFSRSNLVIQGASVLYDLAAHSKGTTAKFGDLNVIDMRPLILGANDKKIIIEFPDKAPRQMGDGIAMFGVQAQNFGHWLVEFLPRMLDFSKFTDLPDAPIYVDPGLPSTILESLRLLNTNGRQICELPNDAPCHFENLVVSAPPNFFPLDFKDGNPVIDTVWPADVFLDLKNKIVAACDQQISLRPTFRRRIFISRKNHASRSLLNSNEIEAYLQSLNFEIVCPEELTFAQQINFFRSASIVVGSCSSALSNAIFCELGTPVIALIHDHDAFNFNGYASFIEAGGAKVTFIRGTGQASPDAHPFHMNYTIDIQSLKSLLSSTIESNINNKIELFSEDISTRKLNLSKLIDESYLTSQLKDSVLNGIDIVEAYITGQISQDIEPNHLFNPSFYKEQVSSSELSGLSAVEHYYIIGSSEGRQPSEMFDSENYLRIYKDVESSGENPLSHFLRIGYIEGRMPFIVCSPDRAAAINLAYERHSSVIIIVIIKYLSLLLSGNIVLLREEISSDYFPTASRLLLSGCLQLEAEGRFEEALSAYQLLISIQPNEALFHFRIGVLFRRLGHLNPAFHHLQQSYNINKEVNYISNAFHGLSKYLKQSSEDITKAKEAIAAGKITTAQEFALRADAARWHDPAYLKSFSVNPFDDFPNILLFDTSFPDPISSFRYGEFSYYLEQMPDCSLLSSTWDLNQFGGGNDFGQMVVDYCRTSGVNYSRVKSLDVRRRPRAKLAYSVFLNNAAVVANRKIIDTDAFAFTLYPGGGFNLNNKTSDILLEKLLTDKRFKKIITTQRLTYDYLVSKGYCSPENILHIFGGIVPACLNHSLSFSNRADYLHGGPMRICFVAQRYSAQGIEKGYDVFVEVASRFRGRQDIEFHVVGGFDETVIDLPAGTNIHFHGIQGPEFFESFYNQMNIIISPAISNLEINGYEGSFDGFPTTTCVEAGVQGVAMFLVDSLGLNKDLNGKEILKSGDEFELISRNPDQIYALIERYINDRQSLADVGHRGRMALLRIFSSDIQLKPRLDMLNNIIGK